LSDRPLRFCFVSTFYPPYNFGGDGIAVRRLAVALADRGHHVEVAHSVSAYASLRTGPMPAEGVYDDHQAIVHHPLRSRVPLLANLITQQTARPGLLAGPLRRLLADGAFDVVHFHNVSLIGPAAFAYPRDAITLYTLHEHWLVCPMHVLWRYNREPCDRRECIRCTLHGRRPPQLWRYTRTLERHLRHVDAFIAPSRFTIDKHREFGFRASSPVVHIPNFLPEPQAAGVAPRTHERPYFLYVGRLERIKGVERVIRAFGRFTESDLFIAGAGHDEEMLRDLARGNPHVHFLGQVGYEQLQPLIQHAIAVVVPSVGFEVFPTTVLEANAQGTPVIGHRLGPLPEMLDERGGITYEGEDELIAALQRLSRDPSHRALLGARGRTTYLEEWTVERHLERYFALIQSLQRGKQPFASRS
jgi:glycosyltransferase involved in cell wall biosynthesis